MLLIFLWKETCPIIERKNYGNLEKLIVQKLYAEVTISAPQAYIHQIIYDPLESKPQPQPPYPLTLS